MRDGRGGHSYNNYLCIIVNYNQSHIMGSIIYLLGVIISIWCVLDIFKKKIGFFEKLIIAILVLATSWIGFAVYYFFVRNRI